MWKGGGDGRGAAWEKAALAGRGGYATDAAGHQWFFLDAGRAEAPPLVLLHGIPAYSYLYRGSVERLVASGRRVLALDLIGFGNSAKPAPEAFDYTLSAYVASLESVLFTTLELPRGGTDLVAQGLLGGTLGMILGASGAVRRLALANTPLDATSAGELPPPLRFLLNPLLGPMNAQNPVALVSKPIESAGIFQLAPDDIAAYIAPALSSGDGGWAAIAAAKALKRDAPQAVTNAMRALEAKGSDVTVIWGTDDRWLGAAPPAGVLPGARRMLLTGAGHFAAEDWSDKFTEALLQL